MTDYFDLIPVKYGEKKKLNCRVCDEPVIRSFNRVGGFTCNSCKSKRQKEASKRRSAAMSAEGK